MEAHHQTREALDAALPAVTASPSDDGTVELIVRRPAVGEREIVEAAGLSLEDGLVGDNWRPRGSSSRPDGGPNPDAQLTLMNVHAAQAVASTRERWPLNGDQLYVDLDLSVENLPAGTRLAVGDAVIEVTQEPHTGCAKFRERFGGDALRWVNQSPGRELRLRGANALVVVAGSVRVGDAIRKA